MDTNERLQFICCIILLILIAWSLPMVFAETPTGETDHLNNPNPAQAEQIIKKTVTWIDCKKEINID